MTPPSLVGVGAALALVLGVMALAVWLLRRFVPGVAQRPGAGGRIEVLGRAALAPRQGVATLKFEGRTALVSYGEGGVRLLMEVKPEAAADGGEERTPAASSDGNPPADTDVALEASRPPFARALGRAARKVPALRALMLGVLLLALAASGRPLSAQSTAGGSAATGAPSVRQPTVRRPAVTPPHTPTVTPPSSRRSRWPWGRARTGCTSAVPWAPFSSSAS